MTDFCRETFLSGRECQWIQQLAIRRVTSRINTDVREVKFLIQGRPIIETIPKEHFVQKHNLVTNFPNKPILERVWFSSRMIWYRGYPDGNPIGTEKTGKEKRRKGRELERLSEMFWNREIMPCVCGFLWKTELTLFCIIQGGEEPVKSWGKEEKEQKRVRERKRRG